MTDQESQNIQYGIWGFVILCAVLVFGLWLFDSPDTSTPNTQITGTYNSPTPTPSTYKPTYQTPKTKTKYTQPQYRTPTTLTYNGYSCTNDCSGHEAGYEYAEDNDLTQSDVDDYSGNSESFREGMQSYVDEQCEYDDYYCE